LSAHVYSLVTSQAANQRASSTNTSGYMMYMCIRLSLAWGDVGILHRPTGPTRVKSNAPMTAILHSIQHSRFGVEWMTSSPIRAHLPVPERLANSTTCFSTNWRPFAVRLQHVHKGRDVPETFSHSHRAPSITKTRGINQPFLKPGTGAVTYPLRLVIRGLGGWSKRRGYKHWDDEVNSLIISRTAASQ